MAPSAGVMLNISGSLLSFRIGHIVARRGAASTFNRRSSNWSTVREKQTTHVGITTPLPEEVAQSNKRLFYFDTGYALFAKRPPRPFPPPFLSPPSGSFSDPLSTHNRCRDRRSFYKGEMIRGMTNGDDAVLVEETLIAANDGVGAWSTRSRGHAALWSRLMLHFWAAEMSRVLTGNSMPDPVNCLQRAFEQTKEATSQPNELQGTTTSSLAYLHTDGSSPLLYAINIGDSRVMVVRPSSSELIYQTKEQWHWFDCPYQLGTNSVDSPLANAICDTIPVQEDDIVIAMTDGLADNLWDHEIVHSVLRSVGALREESEDRTEGKRAIESGSGMMWVAQELVREAREVAENPFAESPYMERAVEEGIGYEGGKYTRFMSHCRSLTNIGKLDDISVVAAVCRRRQG